MRVGIAGYMGAGKTFCARAFESGYTEIIDADARAKALMSVDPDVRGALFDVFGAPVFDGGVLRFDVLGKLAFATAESLRALNRAVHPALVGRLERLTLDCGKPLCILDAALIPLWGVERWFDFCVWVEAPFDERLRRLKEKTPGMDEAELIRRMRLQEETMPAPGSGRWVKLPYRKCQEYILGRLRGSDMGEEITAAICRGVQKC